MALSEPVFEDYYQNPFSRENLYTPNGMEEETLDLEVAGQRMTALVGASAYDFDVNSSHINFILEAMAQAKPILEELEKNRLEFNSKVFVLDVNKEKVSQLNNAKAERFAKLEAMGDMELMRLEIRLEMTGQNPEQLEEVKQVIEARIAATKEPVNVAEVVHYSEGHYGDDISREGVGTGVSVTQSGDALPQSSFNNRDMVVPVIGENLA
ncbi:hypothetical protein LZS94_05180 [Aliivibrio fischeri]|uniref:hypothetical protein n=1 Tax=Aliivibrio fischeri TaxID=668 RepID=UPI001F41E952|nr:hypothetical protein [Aliivibrio fischeri]MCE7576882.1 hypothetical protein [Aliivibrio fischeri]MCE7588996.1 hypothetical protein [Aliivibrio fischeri]